MQRSDGWYPGPFWEWIGEWRTYLWARRPRPRRADHHPNPDATLGESQDTTPAKKPHNLLDNFKGRRKGTSA